MAASNRSCGCITTSRSFNIVLLFRKPLSFPAGTKVEITPMSAGTVALLTYFNSETGTVKTAVFTTPLRWNCTQTR